MNFLQKLNRSRTPTVIGSTDPDAITLGRYLDFNGPPVPGPKMRYGGDLHGLVLGPNGTGKSTRLAIPNLLEITDRSIVVVDPKGELAAVTAPFRRTLGDVVIINPFNILTDIPGYEDLKSQGYNPLSALDPDSPSFNAEAAQLAEALIKVETKDPHWDGSAQALLAATIMYVCIEAQRTGNIPTMADVRALICAASEEPNERNGFQGEGIPAMAREMMSSKIPGLRNKASQFTDWTNEIKSIASAAKRQTEAFDDTEIATDLTIGTFDFRELKKRPITVYIILPPDWVERHSKWLRLLLTAALRGVMRVRKPGEPKTLFILDEFAALGHLQIIETVWALVRGYGIQIIPILQDFHQLKTLYRDRWESFLGMAGFIVSFGAREMTTARWMSDRSGERTEVVAGYNQGQSLNPTGDESTNDGLSWQQIKLPLIAPHQFLAMREGLMFAWLAGEKRTIPVYAPFYKEIVRARNRRRRNPYDPSDWD